VNAAAVPSGARAGYRTPFESAKPREVAFGGIIALVTGVVPWVSVNDTGALVPCWKLEDPSASGDTKEKVYGGFGSAPGNATTKSQNCLVCPLIVGSTPT
jgi:hypothetical protein